MENKPPATRKQLIVQKYTALEKDLKKYIKEDIFPSLDSIDLADLVYFITILFMGISTDAQYVVKVKELMDTNNITVSDEVFVIIFPLIKDFVEWLKGI